jgi:uncharacterized phage-associated protein
LEQLNSLTDTLIIQKNDFRESCLRNYRMTGSDQSVPSEYTGYRRPSLKKMIEMIVYFTEQVRHWKTKMNKLLFYSDSLHYKKFGYSITGGEYTALQMGPVPHNFSSIFEYAAQADDIDINYQEFSNGGIGESFTPTSKRAFNSELFDETELFVMQTIVDAFKNATTSEIVEKSHEEPAWVENFSTKNKIKYSYAFKLKNA